MDLVILAAGLGSRFGGLKQISPIDEDGNFIIDYSIYDAIKTGFDRIIFIIKEENYKDFKQTIGKRIEKQVDVEYAFQGPDSYVPEDFRLGYRTKPWGTAHAILCAKDKVKGDFAIINADDFYGRESFKKVADFLKNKQNDKDFAVVGFKALNTLTDFGSVTRGICDIKDGNLIGFTESVVRQDKDKNVFIKPIGKDEERKMTNDTLASMNLFGFTNKLFDYLEDGFYDFLKTNSLNLKDCEYAIPKILTKYISDMEGALKVLDTNEKWYGLTYKEDLDTVCKGIKGLIEKGIYPKHLWQGEDKSN